MRTFLSCVLLTACLSVGSPLFAQGRGGGAPANRPQTIPGSKDQKQETKNEEKFEERINSNPALRTKVQSLLPDGMSLKTAATGFKNEGQFIAALHVSKNLNIPFDQLKAKTVTDHMPLGSAIHALKPNVTSVTANTEAKKAEDQAKNDAKKKS